MQNQKDEANQDRTTKNERRKYKQTGSAFMCDVVVL